MIATVRIASHVFAQGELVCWTPTHALVADGARLHDGRLVNPETVILDPAAIMAPGEITYAEARP